MSLPSEDKSYRSKNDMLDDIVVLLGGRVAEKVIIGDISTGASNDIERATDIARGMVTRYGMSDEIGPIMYGSSNHEVFLGKDYSNVRNYSEQIASDIDKEIRKIIGDSYNRCHDIIENNIEKLTVVAEYLIKNEKVDGETFLKLMKGELIEAAEEETAENIPLEADETNE